jgi:DNA-binding protein H-NS
MARRGGTARKSRTGSTARSRRAEHLDIKKRKAAFEKARKEAIKLAKAHGLTLMELFGEGPKRKGSIRVKYRDPQNRANTWTGRGRMPRWLAEAIKAGRAREEFLV